MDEALRQLVWERAQDACEYCHIPQRFDVLPFQVDHVIAEKHHGPTHADNLALSCYNCNSYKGPNIAGIDPDTGTLTRLFHPRQDNWDEHFAWIGPELVGLTAIGRTTIDVLSINLPERAEHRRLLLAAGLFPPPQQG
ncbi:MAG: HNH endonuclease [Gemmataceae bacterium]|nr:HNH endonuclease [Gemmataceae bacterium]